MTSARGRQGIAAADHRADFLPIHVADVGDPSRRHVSAYADRRSVQ
jgi:hypothetical protein